MYTIGPARVKYLLPYFPDNLPLIGAITDRVTEYGNIKSPVIRGLYSKISCKKNGSRILFVNIAMYDVITARFPTVKGLIANREKFISG